MMKVSSTITKRLLNLKSKGETVANYGSDCRLQESRHRVTKRLFPASGNNSAPGKRLVVSEINAVGTTTIGLMMSDGDLKLFESM